MTSPSESAAVQLSLKVSTSSSQSNFRPQHAMDGKKENKGIIELGQQALQANREHHDALKTYARRLEVELETLHKLIDGVDAIDETDLDVTSAVTIPGSVRATAPIATKELLSPGFPFHEDALKRNRYQSFTEVHPMNPKELESLAGAVRAEIYRKHSLDVQKNGLPAFLFDKQTHILGLGADGIDWDRVAEKVSAISMTTRTARECEIRWLGEQHPGFNNGPWSNEEVSRVKSLAAEFTHCQPDWVAVAERLGTRRTPLDCMRRATSRRSHQWTTGADERLCKAICMYGHDNWHLVARYVSEDVTPSQCSSRFEKTLDESIKHTAWSPEEDTRLSAAVAAYGSSWVDVAANIPGRHNDQCRDRWTEQVNPRINKSEWSKEEDRILLEYVREHESVSWKEISERLCTGRTETMCRNRYATLQKGANTIPAVSTVNHEVQVTSFDLALLSSDPVTPNSNIPPQSSFPSCSTTSAPPENHANRFVFLEPMVISHPESQEYRGLPTRFKTITVGEIPPPSTTGTLSKKRKARSRTMKSKNPAKRVQQELTS